MMDVLADGTEVAGYRIESVIGRGGMAVVYRAEDTRLGRKVALKLLAPELIEHEQFRQRFVRESRMAASLDHPNIIPIYEAGETDGALFIAMRYVIGSDLKAPLAGQQPIPNERLIQIFGQIGNALDAAHAHGLVHRDVKPGNILLTRTHEETDHVYLTDFGLTKRTTSLSGGLTRTGHFLGTIDYVAPEQIAAKPVEPRTDIYALGCVLYECLTGRLPFHRDDDAALLWAHLVEPPPPVTALRPDLSPEVDAVVARAMAKAPEARFDSGHDLVVDLRDALGTESPLPVQRKQPSRQQPAERASATGAAAAVEPAVTTDEGRAASRHTDHPSFPPGAFDPGSGPPLRPPTDDPLFWEDAPQADAPAGRPSAAEPPAGRPSYAEPPSGRPSYAEPPPGQPSYAEAPPAYAAPAAPEEPPPRRNLLIPLVAGLLVVALVVAGAVLFLGSREEQLSQHVASTQQAPFSVDLPSDWQRQVSGNNTVFSPRADVMAPLFAQRGGQSWSDVGGVVSADPAAAVGLYTTFTTTPIDASTVEQLQATLESLLPRDAAFTSAPNSKLVGGFHADEMEGRLRDAASEAELQFVTYVVQVQEPGVSNSVVLMFFSAPGEFEKNRELFDRILATVQF